MISADEVRQLALSLPGVEERETWGHPTFRVRDKIFATLSPSGQHAGIKSSLDQQNILTMADPETFTIADYTGRYGWCTVLLESVDPVMMRDLVIDAWRRTASKRLIALYDASE